MIPIVLQTDDGWAQGIICRIQLLAPMMEKREGLDVLRVESGEGDSVVGKYPVPRLINPAYCVFLILTAFNGRLGSLQQFGKQTQ
jgi:hypothetical protein